MSLIPRIAIPVSANLRPLSADLGAAHGQVQSFAARASAPVPVRLDLAPLKEHAARATAISARAAADISAEFLGAKVAPRFTAPSAAGHLAAVAIGTAVSAAGLKLAAFERRVSTPVPVRLDLAPLKEGTAKAVEIARAGAKMLAVNYVVKKAGPKLGAPEGSAALTAGKMAIDAATPHVVAIGFKVAKKALGLDLDLSVGLVRASARAMKALALVPFRATTIGLSVGVAAAGQMMLPWVQKKTGWGTVQLLANYAKLKVGLAVAGTLVKASGRAMARAATFPVRVTLGALKASLRTARSMVASAARSIGSVASVPFSPVALAAGGAAAVAGTVGLLGNAVRQASDLNEVVSKVGYTFNGSAGLVTAAADDMAARFGTVKSTFLEGAAGIGLIGKAAGKSDADAAALGVSMTKLAQDLTSFANIPFDSALEKIRSGLVGESEPLRTVGVLLNEDAVKAKAAAMGHAALHGKLSEGVKVMARAALITEGLAVASGDLNRTSGALANSVRGLWGRLQNLSAEIGSFLLPAVQSLSNTFGAMAVDAASAVERLRPTFTAWGEKLKQVADWAGIIYRNLGDIKSIAGMMFGDVARYLGDSIKAAFHNAVGYAKYFGNVLGQAIEKGIQNGLHAAFSGNALLKRFDPGEYQQKVHFLPPKMERAKLGRNPGIDATLEKVRARESLNGLKDRAKGAAGTALGAFGTFRDMTRGAMGSIVAKDKARSDAMNANTSFEAAGRRGAAAAPKASRLPKGFKTQSERLGLAPGASEFEKAMARKGKKPAGDLAPVKNMVAASILGGIGAGIGGFGAAPAVPAAAALAAKSAKPQGPTRFAALAEKGSREDYSAVIRAMTNGPKGKDDKVAKNTAEANKHLKEIADNIKGGGGKFVVRPKSKI